MLYSLDHGPVQIHLYARTHTQSSSYTTAKGNIYRLICCDRVYWNIALGQDRTKHFDAVSLKSDFGLIRRRLNAWNWHSGQHRRKVPTAGYGEMDTKMMPIQQRNGVHTINTVTIRRRSPVKGTANIREVCRTTMAASVTRLHFTILIKRQMFYFLGRVSAALLLPFIRISVFGECFLPFRGAYQSSQFIRLCYICLAFAVRNIHMSHLYNRQVDYV